MYEKIKSSKIIKKYTDAVFSAGKLFLKWFPGIKNNNVTNDGLDVLIDNKPNKKTQNLIETSYDIFSVRDLLPYDVYEPDSQIYINKDSLGWGLCVTPATGSNEELVQILSSILIDVLPSGGDLQFLLWSSPKIGPILDTVKNACSVRGGEFARLAEMQNEFLKKGAFSSLSKQSDFLLRDFQLFLFFSLPKRHKDASIEALIRLREDTMSSLRSVKLGSEILNINNMLSLLNDLLNPNKDIYPASINWNELDPIANQITETEQLINIKSNGIEFIKEAENENWESRCLSVKSYPQFLSQWKMGDSIGQLFNASLQIPCPFLISLSIHLLDQEKSNTQVQAKIIGKDSKAYSQLNKWLPHLSREYQDWKWVRERLSDGDRLVHTYYQVVLFAEQAEINRCERKTRDLFQSNGWKLQRESYLQLQSFLAALPMMMSEGMYKDLKQFKRLKTMTAFNAINIAPLQGEWKGHEKPLLVLPGRRGQLAWWHPFANKDGNYNIAIAAKSRSGKSVLVQYLTTCLVGSGGRCWIIDVGHSYEKTCRRLKGEFISFSLENPICINPFTHIKNFQEILPMLIPLIATMARPKTRTSEEEDAYIQKALVEAWYEYETETTITKVKECLEKFDNPVSNNLAHLLVSYTHDGMYAPFFEGTSAVNLDNPFIVFELLGLKDKKDLQRTVLMVLMAQVHHAMYLGDRSQFKSCIIDEAWDLFGDEVGSAGKFIETGYRTSARHSGNFVTITQSINDYYKSAASIAAFENSDITIVLGQKESSIEQLEKSDRFPVDGYIKRIIKSIRKVEGEFSECVIQGSGGFSLHRITLSPYQRILYSSKGEEFDAVKALEAEGKTLDEAIEIVSRKFQYAA